MANKALMICSNYWTSPFHVGSHQIARTLVRMGWEVGFVSAPISPLHLLGRTDFRRRHELYRSGGSRFLDGRLWAYVPGAWLVPYDFPFLRSRWLLHHWHRLTVPDMVAKARENGFGRVDLLYLDSLTQPCWVTAIEHEHAVLRLPDHAAALGAPPAAVLENEAALARQVDVVVYAARSLEAHVHTLGPRRAMYLPNGVDITRFESTPDLPREYGTINRPIAVYVGAMDYWFDFDLVESAARLLPEISFVLVGPEELARRRMKALPNLHLLGRKDFSAIPAYLQHADVGLIPFDVGRYPELVNHVHPLKLYEYLACGLPVVAVEWTELKDLDSPAVLCRTVTEFVQEIQAAVASTGDRAARIRHAREADWGGRVSALLTGLGLDHAGLVIPAQVRPVRISSSSSGDEHVP